MQLSFAFSALLATTLASSDVPSSGSTATATAWPRFPDGALLVPDLLLPGILSVMPADAPEPTPRFNLLGQRQLQGPRECPSSCDKKGDGRACCVTQGVANEKCFLNAPGNTCTCAAANYECYIDMRCNDQQTWQGGECRQAPGKACGVHLSHECTTGYMCEEDLNKDRICIPSDCVLSLRGGCTGIDTR